MQNKNVYKISNKFYQVLLKMTGLKISRKELIRLAMEVNDLAVYQASGLVDREFNFEVRHSPMPPDGTLRIP